MKMFGTFSHVWMEEGFKNEKNIPFLFARNDLFLATMIGGNGQTSGECGS
jgi:hypothetical protein